MSDHNLFLLLSKFVNTDKVYFLMETFDRLYARISHIFFLKDMEDLGKLAQGKDQIFDDELKIENALHFIDQSNSPVFIHIHWMGTHRIPLFPKIKFIFSWKRLPGRLLNVPLLLASSLMFFFGARRLVPDRWAAWSSLLVILNPIQLRFCYLMMSEVTTGFFACGFLWMLIESFHQKKRRFLWMTGAAFFLMGLAMTRVIFGYVITAGIVAIPACGFIFREHWRPIGRATLVFGMALLMCLPFLTYTYRLTGKPFTWSTTGGEFIYWLASPFEGELGDWQSSVRSIDEKSPELRANHEERFNRIAHLKELEQDAALREVGMGWIRDHPEKTVKNLIANWVRLVSGYPSSYALERVETVFWCAPIYFFLTLLLVTFWPAFRAWKSIPVSIKILALTAVIYVGGTSLLPALPRYLLPVFPFALLWVIFVFSRLLEIRIVTEKPSPLHRED